MKPDLSLILTFHSVSRGAGPLRVAPERLVEQLEWLDGAGFRGSSLRELVDRDEAGARFALTFDDGYRDFADHAWPILEGKGLRPTIFVTAGADRSRLPGGLEGPLLAPAELRGLAHAGVDIGAHSVGHVDLRRLDDAGLERELGDARRALEDWTGVAVTALAYPYGSWSPRVREAASRHYELACTTKLGLLAPGIDRLALPRIDAYYLGSPMLRYLMDRGRPEPYLAIRHWLRRVRGSEPSAA